MAAERLGQHPWGGRADGLPILRGAYAAGGRRGYWRKMLEMETERARRDATPPDAATVSQCYSILGEADQAFAWLEKAREAHSDAMLYLKVSPSYDPIRPDPRFGELLARVNLAR